MRRWVAAAAIVGAIGVAWLLIGIADLLGLLSPEQTRLLDLYLPQLPQGPIEPRWVEAIVSFLFLGFWYAPFVLLLWGLVNIQRTERARRCVVTGAWVLCACTVPFGWGLLLLPPLLCHLFLLAAPINRDPERARSR